MMNITDIASKHLGKAGDGSVVNPYVTPDSVDASLLVAVPRELNRIDYGITSDDFEGVDVWNAYEVSFLTQNGFPINCVAKIIYPSDSPCIVESKSLKLYLNSYNLERREFIDVLHCIVSVEEEIASTLSSVLETSVSVTLFNTASAPSSKEEFNRKSINIEKALAEQGILNSLIFDDHVGETPELLHAESKVLDTEGEICYDTSVLRSNCRVTNQPDWGDVFIYMKGKEVPSMESLLQYIVSMRKENHFHEEICEMIYHRLAVLFSPSDLFVGCLYTRRGGIDINPVRASSETLLYEMIPSLTDSTQLSPKMMRQ